MERKKFRIAIDGKSGFKTRVFAPEGEDLSANVVSYKIEGSARDRPTMWLEIVGFEVVEAEKDGD